MPQMMPINWIFYFLFFISIFVMFNVMNYYIYNNYFLNLKNNNFTYKNKFLPWKW